MINCSRTKSQIENKLWNRCRQTSDAHARRYRHFLSCINKCTWFFRGILNLQVQGWIATFWLAVGHFVQRKAARVKSLDLPLIAFASNHLFWGYSVRAKLPYMHVYSACSCTFCFNEAVQVLSSLTLVRTSREQPTFSLYSLCWKFCALWLWSLVTYSCLRL